MMLSSPMALALTQRGSGGGAAVIYPAWTFHDDFVGAGGALSLTGRVKDGLTWQGVTSGANNDAVRLNGTGQLDGSNGTSPNQCHAAIPAAYPAGGKLRVVRRSNPSLTSATNGNNLHADTVIHLGGNVWNKLTPAFSANHLVAGSFNFGKLFNGAGNGASTTILSASLMTQQHGDVVQTEYDSIANTVTVAINGQTILSGSLATIGFTLNANFGYRGDVLDNSPDDLWIGDPDTQSLLTLISPTRIAPQKANGDVRVWLEGSYTLTAPATVKATLYKQSDRTAISGYSGVALSGLVASGGTFSGYVDILSADYPAAGLFPDVYREDTTGSVAAVYPGSMRKKGDGYWFYGQSLIQQALQATGSGAFALQTDAWYVDGGEDFAASEALSRTNRPNANWPISTFSGTLIAAMGASHPHVFVRGGKGGTSTLQRNPGSSFFTQLGAGIIRAGRALRKGVMLDGTFDSGSVARGTYVADHDSQVDAIETLTGETQTVLLCPVGCVQQDNTDAEFEALRYMQWMMCDGRHPTKPSRYKWGPPSTHLQHGSGGLDQYHLTDTGYNEELRLVGECVAFALNSASGHDRTGPKLSGSITTDSATQTTTWIDPNGADGISVINQSAPVSGFFDCRGGLDFADDDAFANIKIPTSVSVGAISGGLYPVVHTYAAGTWTGKKARVRAHYGKEPFNNGAETSTTVRDQIRAAMATEASMLVGTYGVEPTVPVQPSFQVSGVNFYVSP